MKYMGSKNRIAKHILPIMVEAARNARITNWVEPMVGGGNMIDKVPQDFQRLGFDINDHCIKALICVRDYIDSIPDELTEDRYKEIKGSDPDPITSWLRFVGCFGGKFENGYAREKGSDSRTFIGYGKRNAIKQSPNIQGVELVQGCYKNMSFKNSLIYCDPPYKGTTGYKTGEFNHDDFFQWCRNQRVIGNIVFVSEYTAPNDFIEVWSGEIKTNFDSRRSGATHNASEKLFTLK